MIRINLLPPEFGQAQKEREQRIFLGGIIGVVVFLMSIFLFLKKGQANSLKDKIEQSETQLKTYQAIVDQIKSIEGKKQRLTAKRDVIINLNRSRLLYPVFFEDLLPLIPSDVWIMDLRLENQSGNSSSYRMTSKALSNYALATWLTNLEQSTHFSNIKIDRINYDYSADRGNQPTLSFNLSFTYQHQGPLPEAGIIPSGT